MSDWFAGDSVSAFSPTEVLTRAIEEYRPVRVFACFSSGNDSQVTTHFAMQNNFAHEVFNINTGIGIPEAREHFYRTCDRFNWPMRVKTPPDLDYEEMVMAHGFPGPGAHTYPYSWLKQRAIEELMRETKRERSDRVMLITGVRRSESTRRMGHVEPIYRDGAQVWVAPMYAWSKREMDEYMERHMLVRNPVTENLGISGECLCGAFRSPGERKRLRVYYPDFDSYLCNLEDRAKEAKQPYCHWGSGIRLDPNQEKLNFMPMCTGCLVQNRKDVTA